MKRNLLSLGRIFFLTGAMSLSAVAYSQAPISYTQISDVNMLIANIFGVQCEGVSNVQVTGPIMSVGRFDNGQGVGLSSGMVLSTGWVNGGGPQNVNIFSSFNMGMPGDADINQYALNGTGTYSFDAVSVQFDFTPQVTDTISFRYIFASEEYPEYSNTQYTDRFLFLVSENGGMPYNIAMVPGSTTAVEINSVNQLINNQYYTDNQTVPSAAYFIYDGYTTPFFAKFLAVVGSTYHIKLVIADVSDGVYDSAIFLDEQESYNNIEGDLTVNNLPAEGILDIFNYTEDTLLALPVQSIVVSNGAYVADSLPTGMYHARFTPDPVLFPGAVPLYFSTGSSWSEATLIGLPCYLDAANIDADTVNGFDGSGQISGVIYLDTSFQKSVTEPFEGAMVKLADENDDIIAFAYTNENGEYTLTGLPAGTFTLVVDVPYVPQADTYTVTLWDGQEGTGFDFEVLTDGIFISGDPVLGVNDNKLSLLNIHPNPANTELTLNLPEAAAGQTLKVMTINGQEVISKVVSGGVLSLDVSNLEDGTYIVQLPGSQPERIVISH